MAISLPHRSWRSGWRRCIHWVRDALISFVSLILRRTFMRSDTPIKRFAQRYTYLGIDTIAGHDLGFARRSSQTSTPLDANQALPSNPHTSMPQPPTGPLADRDRPIPSGPAPRRASPDPRRRSESSPPPAKRFRPASPPPGRRVPEPRDNNRDRWEDRDRPGPSSRRPASPAPAPTSQVRAREPEGGIPSEVLRFIGMLPSASAFDGMCSIHPSFKSLADDKLILFAEGPVFRTSDLMDLFRHGNIPSPSASSAPSGPSAYNYGGHSSHLQPPASRPRSPLPPPRGAYPFRSRIVKGYIADS
jgi:cleavage stimulation factor subunit 3